MELSDFTVGVIYETRAKTHSEPVGFVPIIILPAEDKMVVMYLWHSHLKDISNKPGWKKSIDQLREGVAVFDLLENPRTAHAKYSIPLEWAEELHLWQLFGGKFITDQDELITQFYTVRGLLQNQSEDGDSENEEYELFHKLLGEMSGNLAAITQSVIGMCPGKNSSIQWVHEIKHAEIEEHSDGVDITTYNGVKYSITMDTLKDWGYVSSSNHQREVFRRAYETGYRSAIEDMHDKVVPFIEIFLEKGDGISPDSSVMYGELHSIAPEIFPETGKVRTKGGK